MLKLLCITNLILIESAEIQFAAGLNILSGETGSGKSAIISALNMLNGDRADPNWIRRGADKGAVEALFELPHIAELHILLSEAGIELSDDHPELCIRREISLAGKNRIFINHQITQLSLLKQLSKLLFDIVGQHANQKLLSLDQHRTLLDLFGELEPDVEAFGHAWQDQQQISKDLELLVQNEAQRLRDIEICQAELEELFEAQLKTGEDEEAFKEYSRLANADELASKISELYQSLSSERNSVVHLLQRQKNNWEQALRLDGSLQEMNTSFQQALIELQELAYSLQHYLTHIEHNPERLAFLNARLSLINRLKRKYGPSLDEVFVYIRQSEKKLCGLENGAYEIEQLKERLTDLVKKNQELAQQLTLKRKKAAEGLRMAILAQLKALNMPKADFQINITPQSCHRHGQDQIEFLLAPNAGERFVSVREGVSGGELARLLLALQTILKGKTKTPILVFDEIDASIGGATASLIGQRLLEIGQEHQVLCITHFPQVAKYAQHHLQIFKAEHNGRTLTSINTLDHEAREKELSRMQGG